MILHVDPVPGVLSGPVHRKGRVLQRVHHEQRDELLRVLVRSVVVGAARDDDRQSVRREVGEGETVRPGLRGCVGALRHERVQLRRGTVRGFAVHFVGRDMENPPDVVLATGLENRPGPDDVRSHEVTGLEDGPVDMGLRGEMNQGFRGLRDPVHELPIAHVSLDEREVPVVLVVLQIVWIPGVCELVHDNDFVLAGGQPAAHKAAPDETHAAGDDEACHDVSLHLDVPIIRDVLRIVGDAELIRLFVVVQLRREIHKVHGFVSDRLESVDHVGRNLD